MRLFATITLLALSLFWSYPFFPPAIEQAVRNKVTPAPRGKEPVLVLAPADIRVPPRETVAARLTESSEDPRQ